MNEPDRQEELNRLLGDLKNGDEPTRRYAAEDLGFGHFNEAVPHLASGLTDPSIAVAEACATALMNLGGDTVARQVVKYLASEDVRLRNLTSEVLSKIGNDAVPALAAQLSSLDRDVRKFAVDSLLTIRSEASLKALVVALDDSDVNVAATAADGLGEIGNQDHLEILATYLRTEDEWMRCAVVRGMTSIGGPKALRLVANYLQDPSMVVKITCIQGVGNIHEPEAAVSLIRLLESEDPGFFTSEVITALHSVLVHLRPEQLEGLPLNKTATVLGASLADSLKATKLCAIDLIGRFGFLASIPDLINCLKTPDPEIRVQAVQSLSLIRQSSLAPYLEVLQDPEQSAACKISVLEVASKVFDTEAIQLFELAFTSGDIALVVGATLQLPAALGESFVTFLRESLGSLDTELRQAAAETLGRIGSEQFVSLLVNQLNLEENEEVLEALDSSLVSIGCLSETSGIRPYIQSFRAEERAKAIQLYGFERPQDHQDKMEQTSVGGSTEDRVIAFKVLANLNLLTPRLITQGMGDPNTRVQLEAVRGIGGLSDLELKIELIKNQLEASPEWDERVSVELVNQLVSIGGELAVSLIRPFLHSTSIWVRVEAVEGLKSLGDPSVIGELKDLIRGAEDEFLEALEQAIYKLE